MRSSPLTRNVLVNFDREARDDESILAAVRTPEPDIAKEIDKEDLEAPPVQRERRGPEGRARRTALRGSIVERRKEELTVHAPYHPVWAGALGPSAVCPVPRASEP